MRFLVGHTAELSLLEYLAITSVLAVAAAAAGAMLTITFAGLDISITLSPRRKPAPPAGGNDDDDDPDDDGEFPEDDDPDPRAGGSVPDYVPEWLDTRGAPSGDPVRVSAAVARKPGRHHLGAGRVHYVPSGVARGIAS